MARIGDPILKFEDASVSCQSCRVSDHPTGQLSAGQLQQHTDKQLKLENNTLVIDCCISGPVLLKAELVFSSPLRHFISPSSSSSTLSLAALARTRARSV